MEYLEAMRCEQRLQHELLEAKMTLAQKMVEEVQSAHEVS